MLREVPQGRLVKAYVSTKALEKPETVQLLKEVDYEEVDDTVFRQISDTQTPQGVLAIVHQEYYQLESLLQKPNPFLLIGENLQDPGNLGTMVRTGEGAGVDGIILSQESVDIYNPKTIRATMGSVYRVPVIYAEDLQDILRKLAGHGIVAYAAHLDGIHNYDEEDYRTGTALLIGNEGNGLSGHLANVCDHLIRIPMEGHVESLNAAVAASILMYEVYRQRR